MPINFDPKIVRKGQSQPTPVGREFASLDNPKPGAKRPSTLKQQKASDPAQAAFSTNCAFLSRFSA